MAQRYRLTPKRRAALKKAQLASARKRRRTRNIKRGAVVGGAVVGLSGAAVARHKLSGSSFSYRNQSHLSPDPYSRIPGKLTVTGSRKGGFSTTTTSSKRAKPSRRNAATRAVLNRFTSKKSESNPQGLAGNRIQSLANSQMFNAEHRGRMRPTGRKIQLQTKKRGPLGGQKTVAYEHKRLTAEVLGTKIKQTRVGNQLAFKTRGIRGKKNPYAPDYDPFSSGGYPGQSGKRFNTGMTKYRGGKKVVDKIDYKIGSTPSRVVKPTKNFPGTF